MDEESNSNPAKSIMNETIRAERYSILPNPRGWECVGLLLAMILPIIVTKDERISPALLIPSETIATDPLRRPITIFTAAIIEFNTMDNSEFLLMILSLSIFKTVPDNNSFLRFNLQE